MIKKRKSPKADRIAPGDKRIAVIWTRVSTKEQAEHNLSLGTQEKAGALFAVSFVPLTDHSVSKNSADYSSGYS